LPAGGVTAALCLLFLGKRRRLKEVLVIALRGCYVFRT